MLACENGQFFVRWRQQQMSKSWGEKEGIFDPTATEYSTVDERLMLQFE